MASILQQAVTGIQLNDYVTRMLVDRLQTFRLLILAVFLVMILSAVGYDYSK